MSTGLPRWQLAPAAIGFALVVVPLVALAYSVEWSRFLASVSTPASQDALWLRVRTATASTLLCVVLGVPMAAVLARTRWRGLPLLRQWCCCPWYYRRWSAASHCSTPSADRA